MPGVAGRDVAVGPTVTRKARVGGVSWFVTEGNPYTGVNSPSHDPVEIANPTGKPILTFKEATSRRSTTPNIRKRPAVEYGRGTEHVVGRVPDRRSYASHVTIRRTLRS